MEEFFKSIWAMQSAWPGRPVVISVSNICIVLGVKITPKTTMWWDTLFVAEVANRLRNLFVIGKYELSNDDVKVLEELFLEG